MLHVLPLQLVLRSINSARSAFLAVNFSANFFESYSVFGGTGLVQAGVLLKVRHHGTLVCFQGSHSLTVVHQQQCMREELSSMQPQG